MRAKVSLSENITLCSYLIPPHVSLFWCETSYTVGYFTSVNMDVLFPTLGSAILQYKGSEKNNVFGRLILGKNIINYAL